MILLFSLSATSAKCAFLFGASACSGLEALGLAAGAPNMVCFAKLYAFFACFFPWSIAKMANAMVRSRTRMSFTDSVT